MSPRTALRSTAPFLLLLAAACGGDEPANGTPPLPPGMRAPAVTNADGAPPAVPFSPATPVVTPRVLRDVPHDSAAYTQGLLFHEGRLFEGTGLEGQSDVREVDPRTGATVRRAPTPAGAFGEGIAVGGGKLFQLTWKDGIGHVYDPTTLRSTATVRYEGEGWGLTTDGTLLYMSDGTSRIRVIAPDGFTVQRTFEVTEAGRPVRWLNELELVDGELWANIYQTDLIARIDPGTGQVVGWVKVTGLLTAAERSAVAARGGTANGIAFDPVRKELHLTGKLWPRRFVVAMP